MVAAKAPDHAVKRVANTNVYSVSSLCPVHLLYTIDPFGGGRYSYFHMSGPPCGHKMLSSNCYQGAVWVKLIRHTVRLQFNKFIT